MARIDNGTAYCEEINKIKRQLKKSRENARTQEERRFIDSEIKRADDMLERRRRRMHKGGTVR